ncbi:MULTISPECIES: molybdenum ABC transporter ATP-binding protein [Comamonas]|uniref:molybdenum ABC transporter ATP-binding protein n=1 Tax=Comamonas TaxID=283 RepID=UPI00050E1CB6|nr:MULTISPECIES: molybdenum ABC transporter ATP-binding protein [Comamonas]KGG94887.1 molybdenum ABC transporter ATP-binding protein [Comamonas thiooxydans]KGH01899.1 molybdenum ABC transporter ATP-binding protein [Comamonas thiooxydans]KGH03232.1 molybdenum ABC transporter ATP-binding protein [Comamonas thiooxydans]KGH11919.1 molybdenum ABC transporter ATP-binding protein [Comamonas thiooxydans]TZG11255.1 molybdenum ABC transporter ATP-binding protein [Comamonas thiooxydans]
MTATNFIAAQLRLSRPDFELDVDLQLPGQGVTALFGPSGCGKTSCLRSLAGLERAQGRVTVNQTVWQDDTSRQWLPTHQRALGYVFQEASLFPHLSVQRNIDYGLKRTPQERRKVSKKRAVELLGISHLMDRMPATLSGGERQRVAIARALATSPEVLLMDEPLAALDAQRKAEVLPYLEQLQRHLRIPVIYVSHSMDEVARLAQHMVLLGAGKVLAQGSVTELLSSLDLPLAHGDVASSVVHATVQAHDAADHLSTLIFDGGQLQLVMARPREPGSTVPLRVQARDVSLSLLRPEGSSILNILPVQVLGLREDGPGQVMVSLQAGGTRLLARITRHSAKALQLQAGMPVYAQIKGMALLD